MRPGLLNQFLGLGLILSLPLLAGCGGQQTQTTPGPITELVPANDARGLTIRWLALNAETGQAALLRALEPHLRSLATPIAEVDRRRWAENGLAMVCVPASAIRGVERALPLTAVQARNSADMLTWSDLATGPNWSEDRPVASPDGTTRLSPGRIRMLGRSWATPTLTESGPQTVTRLELILQHLPDRPPLALQVDPSASTSKGALTRGAAFARTAIGLDLPPDQCVVIFAEPPGTNRQAIVRPESLDRPETTANVATPPSQPVLTLGELLLAGFANEGQVRTRVVLVIMGRQAASAAKLDQ